MNKRIEQIAEQCGMTIDKYGLARDAQTGLEDGVDIYKFAELLVRMCADAADMYQEAGCEYVGDAVAEYMGYGTEEGVVEWRAKC